MNSQIKSQFDTLNKIISQNKASSERMLKQMSGQNELDAYKSQMIKAKQEIINAPRELKAAEKAYFTKKFGLSGYQDYKETKAKQEINKQTKKWTKSFTDELDILKNYVNILISQNIYADRIDDIRDNYVIKQNDLENKVSKSRSEKNVDDRLTNYYNSRVESNTEFTWYLNKIYWGTIIIYFLAILYNDQYKNLSSLFVLFSSILILYVGNMIRKWIQFDTLFKRILEYFSQSLMYVTFAIRVILDKLF